VRPVEPGRVYLVGAGPGDPELLTLRAAAVLAAADAVFHDRLVSEAVLATARRDAERVDVGHRAGSVRRELAEVAGWMATRARRGQVVARLKGGDPFVFGRGGEEVQALAALGVPCEVVPGVSSALAAPAAAGIPVSHRGLSRSIVIATGHDRDPAGRPAWATPTEATLVVLMGSARLPALAEDLIEAGWEPDTPAAVVMAATTPRQRQVCGRLGEIAERAAGARLGPPSVLVVGEVVSLAPLLAPAVAPSLALGLAPAAASPTGVAE
jgi:uroporphyrin-III C-methyltransferase